MILHQSCRNHPAVDGRVLEASRARIGMIVLESTIAILGILNLAASLA